MLDEGLAVVTDIPMTGRPVALIGIAEKGYATLKITAPATGGHSSAPPKETGVETLAKAVLAITAHPFPMKFTGPAARHDATLAPEAGLPVRIAVANTWLFEPLLIRQIATTPGRRRDAAHDHRPDHAARAAPRRTSCRRTPRPGSTTASRRARRAQE